MTRALIAGNWKMNCLKADGLALCDDLSQGLTPQLLEVADWLVCPPFALIDAVASRLGDGPVAVGAQDCHTATKGAHTGDVAAAMIADLGCSHVIVGHSERRQDHGESDALVREKAEAALTAGLCPVVCVGETREEREAGSALSVVEAQLRGSLPASAEIVVAYEPVWAIGTGLIPTSEDVAAMHAHIDQILGDLYGEQGASVRILYGGSVKPDNAAQLLSLPRVDGALVGGASLKAGDFLAIGGSLVQN